MKSILDINDGIQCHPIIRLEAESDEEKRLFNLIWNQDRFFKVLSYNGKEKLAITPAEI